MIENPHFDYPFRFGADGHAICLEQDDPDEIRNCVVVLLKTPIGTRMDVPDFGVPEQLFRMGGIREEIVLNALRAWEPRAAYTMTLDTIRDLAQVATVYPTLRGTNG
jgi:phage baseplate assembly protein W